MEDKLFRKVALEKLSSPEELDQLMQVTTPRGWLALVAVVALVIIAVVVGLLAKLPIRLDASACSLVNDSLTGQLVAAVYLTPPGSDETVELGDEVRLLPFGAVAERDGYLLGSVMTIAYPAREDVMLAALGSRAQVDRLLEENALVEVRVMFTRAPETGNYVWTSGRDAALVLQPQTPCEAAITVDELEPVRLLLREVQ
ncbi:MAG: hypothetical protein JNJ61_26325 [Anaerolineae bacterium]|nr:hypothetical protein [Anaerolineae bacterium]